jgi:hypothetical protein
MNIISPAQQAAMRRQEAKIAMDSARYLATAMTEVSPDLKKAAGRQILSGLRNFLALSQAATFWDEAARRV